MGVVRILGMGCLAGLMVWLGGCATMQPDRYQGEGLWIRGDGTTYSGAPLLAVAAVEIVHSRVRERAYVTEEQSTNAQGQVVIREKTALTMNVEVELSIRLENGEIHALRWLGEGPEGVRRYQSGSFTAANAKVYVVTGNIHLLSPRPAVMVHVHAPGPVDYRTTLNVN